MSPAKIRRFLSNANDAEIPVSVETASAKMEGYVWHVGTDHFELVSGQRLEGFEYAAVAWIGLAL